MIKTFKVFRISKNNGKFRNIVSAQGEYKYALSECSSVLSSKFEKLDDSVNYAFIKGKNAVMNAKRHVGFEHTLSMDLKDFFDSVSSKMVKKYLTKSEIELCFVNDIAAQGLPTSPTIANFAFLVCDKAIKKALKKHCYSEVVYTRYADDLCFSFNDEEFTSIIIKLVTNIVKKAGFSVNTKKTKLQSAKSGMRIITGLAVDKDVKPTRKTKRKLRAAIHQGNKRSAQGLKEWAKCKEPTKSTKIDEFKIAEELSKKWRLRAGKIKQYKIETISHKEIVITNNPVSMLGMSTFTTGWTSCVSKKRLKTHGSCFLAKIRGNKYSLHSI